MSDQAKKEMDKAKDLKLKLDMDIAKVQFLRDKLLTGEPPGPVALNDTGKDYFKTQWKVHQELTLRPSYITRHFMKAESANPEITQINEDAKDRLMKYMGNNKESNDEVYKLLMQSDTLPTTIGKKPKNKGRPSNPKLAAAAAFLELIHAPLHRRHSTGHRQN